MSQSYFRGYIVHPTDVAHVEFAAWERFSLNQGYDLHVQEKTEASVVHGSSGHCVALIGRAFDYDEMSADTCDVAQIALERFEAGGLAGCLEYIAYLGGRFACFLSNDDSLFAVPDCHATYAIYSAKAKQGTVFASHWQLAAQVLGLPASEEVSAFMRSPDYVSPGGKFYPGLKTPFDGVTCVFANCFARLNYADRTMKHERFYPVRDLPAISLQEAKQKFTAQLEKCLKKTVVDGTLMGLTAGLDSLNVLSSLRGFVPKDMSTFTYVKQQNPDRAQLEDVFGANLAAIHAGLPHRIFEVAPVDFQSDFHKIYVKSFEFGARYPALARAMYENLPHDRTILISLAAETGTVFYKVRDGKGPTPEALAKKHTQSKASQNPNLIKWMEEYIAYTAFTQDRLFNFAWEDLFYWEHRNTKWATLWYSEIDMTGFAIVPFNSRKLIETMLALPIEHRQNRTLQKFMIEDYGLMR
ncbi:hypothetical protein ACS3QZ_19380 (plasmid) [Shimia sp. W99]